MEIRYALHRWDEMPEEEHDLIKSVAQRFAYDWGYEHFLEYYWIRFTDENYLLARLALGGRN